jgi:acyl-CoA thioesterase-1
MSRWIPCLLLLWFAGVAGAAPPRPILVVGDSLSAVYRIDPEQGWVHLLGARLRGAGIDRPVVNASIPGETSSGALTRLPGLLARHRPALVLIELGANDGLRGLPLAALAANLERMVAQCRKAGAGVVLLGIELPVNYGPQYRDGLRRIYRDLARKSGAPLVPFLLDGVALDAQLMQDDGLHPTAAGEPRVLDNVWSVLAPVVSRLATH